MKFKKFLPRTLSLGILYSLTAISSAFSIFVLILATRIESAPLIPHPKNSFCDKIVNISTEDENIVVNLKSSPTNQDITDIKNFLRFETEAFSTLLIFPFNTFQVLQYNSSTITGFYNYPFLQEYSGNMLCFSDDKAKQIQESSKIETQKFIADKIFPIHFKVSNFDNSSEYTQMKCKRKTIQKRYCVTRNLILRNNIIYFYSRILYKFPSPFLSLSSQPIPNDVVDTRLDNQPVVVKTNPLGKGGNKIQGISYFYCRGVNLGMLWHNIFDNVAPLYHTIQEVEGSVTGKDRHFIVTDIYVVEVFVLFLKMFTKYPIHNIQLEKMDIQFDICVLGLRKFNTRPLPFRNEFTTFDFSYDPKDISIPGFRETILKELRFTIPIPDPKKPLVIIPLRKNNNTRFIVNMNSVIKEMERRCKFCEFLYLNLDSLTIEWQIELISHATVLAGIHGSGLAHQIWMNSSKEHPAYVFEFLPPNYWCRDWYNAVADAFNIKYYKVFGEQIRFEEQLDKCVNVKELCISPECHDILRDQNMRINIEQLGNEWQKIVDNL